MRKKLIVILLAGLMFFTPALLAETVYKSTDAQGNTVFTDLPTPDSQKINIQPAQTYSLPSPPPPNGEGENGKLEKLKDFLDNSSESRYEVSILSPQDKETLSTDIHSFTVSISVNPQLKEGDKIQLLLNGEPYGEPSTSTDIVVSPDVRLPRGSYQLQARVVSGENPSTIKGESSTITFYQFRKSILVPRS